MEIYEQFLEGLKKAFIETMEQNRLDAIRYFEIIQEVGEIQRTGQCADNDSRLADLKQEVEALHEKKFQNRKNLEALRANIEKLKLIVSRKEETKTLQ